MSHGEAKPMEQVESSEELNQHRKSNGHSASPWGSSAASLPISPVHQPQDFHRNRWTPTANYGEPAASETTSPERLALGASTDPQQHLDPSRFVPQAPFNQGFSYFLDQSQPDSSSSSTDLSASKWNQSYGTTPTMPMTIPGDHSLRSLSTSTSSTDSSVHGGDLLGGLDPTPRAHDPSAVRPGRGSAESRSRSGSAFSQIDPQNSLILQRRPSTDAPSFTENPSTYGPTINQQSSWLPSTGFAASPTSSIVSLPSYSPIQCGQQQQHQQHHSSDPTLWGQFNAFKLDSKSNLTSPASSTFSEPGERALPFSSVEPLDSTGAENGSRKSRQRKSANQPEITTDPLFWRSQTTRATKQASIARRKPGSIARFACPYCGECFTRKYNLNGHVRAHKGERPFACDQPGCVKAFSRQHDLKRHRELHATAEKYRCASCLKGFRKIDALARHYRSEPSCTDPYPDVDSSIFPELYLSTAVLNGAELPNGNGTQPSPAEAQRPRPLPEVNTALAMSSNSTSLESVQSAYF